MGQRAALSHGLAAACHGDKDGLTCGVTHRQAVFVRACIEYSDVVACGPFDQSDQIAQWLTPQVVVAAEFRGRHRGLVLS
ncbi:hypothetical protein MHEL_10630 [Mycolicibacterium helvum]|uniref:Uncharacterized protein n=1 Tax=Mycolicibacterium helvum TaxID=1534349 RepID=A0A7I7T1K5_9MYCO|nr:hypothetical protein MHEL_10630 [Mycolicibacterium helvum]